MKCPEHLKYLLGPWPLAKDAKPRVSLTAPNCDHFPPVSLTVLGAFLSARAKAKKLICESIAQDLVRV